MLERRAMLRTLSLLILINLIAALIAAVILSAMFGALAGSVTAGLIFPLAILSMAAEGDPWGVWIIASLALTALWVASSRLIRPRKAARRPAS